MKLRAGDWVEAWRFIFDRIEGPPAQHLELHMVRDAANTLAEQYGLRAEDLLAEAERLALPDGKG